MTLHGVAASAGVGIGKAVCLRPLNLDYSQVQSAGPAVERARLDVAMQTFFVQTQALASQVRAETGPQEAAILEGQIAMLQDPSLQGQIGALLEQGKCAEAALDAVCAQYETLFGTLEDELMAQRAADVRDMRNRMLALLLGCSVPSRHALPPNAVIVARDLIPSLTVGLPREKLAAFLTQEGGTTSHAAILARAMGIPAVVGVAGLCDAVGDGDTVVADGADGVVVVAPDADALARYRKKQSDEWARRAALEPYRWAPTKDADQNTYVLETNIGSHTEAGPALAAGAEGVGLLRTEFLFMQQDRAPTEEEQCAAYSQAAQALQGRPLVVRTLDVGGDKNIPYLGVGREENPALGQRGIRWCLSRAELFCTQLKALLRAGAQYPNIKILLPMVTGVQEVQAARTLLARCAAQLKAAGVPCAANMPVGVMIETPAAALTADLLAKEADFFSIGTNDLTQYTLAVDRGNMQVQAMHSPFHPAVLRAVQNVIAAARQADIPVAMCGEAAADPRMTPVLMAFGLQEFSVGVASVPVVRHQISAWHLADAKAAARQALCMPDAESVERYLGEICVRRETSPRPANKAEHGRAAHDGGRQAPALQIET